jgi:hypothetical protein
MTDAIVALLADAKWAAEMLLDKLLDSGFWLLQKLFVDGVVLRDRARWAGGMLFNPLLLLTACVVWLGDLLRRAPRYFFPRSGSVRDLELGLKKTQ